MTELSDELLVAYVDGQLARAQSRAVEKVLKQDDVLASRVDALKAAHGRLEAAFEAILAGEVEEVSQYAVQTEAKPSRSVPLSVGSAALGACVGLALAAALHFWPGIVPLAQAPAPVPAPAPASSVADLPPKRSDRLISSWQDEVARSEAMLSRASLEVGLDSQGNRDLVAFQLAGAIGPNLQVPDLEPQGFHFVRGALLQYAEKPLAQMLYLPDTGNPVALYAMAGEDDRAPVTDQAGSTAMVSWTKAGIAYLLAGSGDADALMRIAGKIENEPLAPVPTPESANTPAAGADVPPSNADASAAAATDSASAPPASAAPAPAASRDTPPAPTPPAGPGASPSPPSVPTSAGSAN